MSIAVANQGQPEIGRGIVYTVTWADNTDVEAIEKFTPMSARNGRAADPSSPPSWLMLGSRLIRFMAWTRSHGGDPGLLEFSPWTDVEDISARFADVFGLPGRMGFDPAGMIGHNAVGREFGGHVTIVEADLLAGAELVVRPIKLGSGWVGLVARTGSAQRVLAIKSETVAVVVANMLSSACRRTRGEALAFLASSAWLSYPALVALLRQRKSSSGLSDHEARMRRLGDLLGLDAALPCATLFELAQHDGRAAISIAASGEAVEPHSCGTMTDSWV